MALNDTLNNQNEGYWILSLDDVIWDIGPGQPVTESAVQVSADCTSPQGCYELPLSGNASALKRMLGNPLPSQVAWAEVRLQVAGDANSPYTPTEAQAAGLMSNTYWTYNGNGYDSFEDAGPNPGILSAAAGFWVEVLPASSGKDMKLLMPAGGITQGN
ncbi:MAG: hypothetical protein KZQ58_02865 [gamma proteobacterium symbiont of Bathyaustriella thionipta]|nr:hypothetical protein [gamma proteobacterium symbiont of Bathyaustriella thionipta]